MRAQERDADRWQEKILSSYTVALVRQYSYILSVWTRVRNSRVHTGSGNYGHTQGRRNRWVRGATAPPPQTIFVANYSWVVHVRIVMKKRQQNLFHAWSGYTSSSNKQCQSSLNEGIALEATTDHDDCDVMKRISQAQFLSRPLLNAKLTDSFSHIARRAVFFTTRYILCFYAS